MLTMLKNWKVRTKIVLPVCIILVLLVTLLVVFVMISVTNLSDDLSDERVATVKQIAQSYVNGLAERNRSGALAVAGSQTIIDSVRNWNDGVNHEEVRQTLQAYLADRRGELGMDSFVVTDQEGNVILRLHDMSSYGDNIGSSAHMSAALGGNTMTLYSETRAMPMGLTAAVPVFENGVVIGAVSAQVFFYTEDFVDRMSETFNAEVTIFAGNRRVASTIKDERGQRIVDTELENEQVLDIVLNQGQPYTVELTLFGEPYSAFYFPLLGGGGTPVGMFFIGFSDANTESATNTLLLTLVIIGVVGLAVAALIVLGIANLISKPLVMMSGAMEQLGTKGDLNFTPELMKSANECASWQDEIGKCARAFGGIVQHIGNIASEMKAMADGDLSVEIDILSEEDAIGVSMRHMLDNLNKMFSEINSATMQVSTGSKQIADGAQSLAQGSTEQSASIQQLSASIAEIAERTKANAETAGKTSRLSDTIKENAEKGSKQMDEMTAAVKEINQSSHNISKVIKVIDDIAFQTNILALNAAVEAARAGQHGKGFAVVAEEVRNLAAKSAEAAKDTSGLISSSMEKAELGARIADSTASSLAEIVSGINESAKLVNDIAKSSEEQSLGIAQINNGIDQVAQVVQQNSATAEESAAASVEMSGQSDMLERLVSKFKLKDGDGVPRSLPSANSSSQRDFSSQQPYEAAFGRY